jgi:hypothetical protein
MVDLLYKYYVVQCPNIPQAICNVRDIHIKMKTMCKQLLQRPSERNIQNKVGKDGHRLKENAYENTEHKEERLVTGQPNLVKTN